jgi:hypothetical protein
MHRAMSKTAKGVVHRAGQSFSLPIDQYKFLSSLRHLLSTQIFSFTADKDD